MEVHAEPVAAVACALERTFAVHVLAYALSIPRLVGTESLDMFSDHKVSLL